MDRIQEIRDRLEKATPGPWQWDGSKNSKTVDLETWSRGRHTVMSFERWGFYSACPTFTESLEEGNQNLKWNSARILQRADKWMVNRQSHHEGWDMDIIHPDAQLIAHAPEDIRFLLGEIERLQGELEKKVIP